jgi:hypothetical protein
VTANFSTMCSQRRYHAPVVASRDADDLRSRPNVRASDAEREGAAARLREHAAAGRLDLGELEERLGAAYAARTRGELAALLADLPALARPVRAARPVPQRPARRLGDDLRVFAGINLLLVAIWMLTGAGYFWPVWVMVWWGAALAVKLPLAARSRSGGLGTSIRR